MSVTAVRALPYSEIQGWFQYFQRRPLGWREDSRTHMLMQAAGVEKKAAEIFPSIRTIMDYQQKIADENPLMEQTNKLRSSGFLARLQAAAAKNNSDWKLDD